MNIYVVNLPDGKTDTRRTKHEYKFVTMVNIGSNGWFACYSASFKNAQAVERKYRNCPAVFQGESLQTIIKGLQPEITKDFDPATMTRATFDDVQNMMDKLWGSGARAQYRMIAPREDGELLDLTQIERNDG